MVIEGRTVNTLEDLEDFCRAARRAAKVDAEAIRMSMPVDIRLVQTVLPHGTTIYDVLVKPWEY